MTNFKRLSFILFFIFVFQLVSDPLNAQVSISKRKYRKGFNIELFSIFKKKHPFIISIAKAKKTVKENTITNDSIPTEVTNMEASIEDHPIELNNAELVNQQIKLSQAEEKLNSEILVEEVCDEPIKKTLDYPKEKPLTWKERKATKVVLKKFYSSKSMVTEPSKKTDGMAIAGFVCGIVGLIVAGIILGVLAIVFSIISLGHINKDPNKKGKGLAIAGLILGVLDVIGAILFISTMQNKR
jgi:hypothetical protein